MWSAINKDNNPQAVCDKHFPVQCPHCNLPANLSAVSIPRYEYLNRFRPEHAGVVYRCDSCNEPVMLVFQVQFDKGKILFSDEFTQIQRPQEIFEYEHLPDSVATDFREALTCYSQGCFNAFAAMCRRCVQTGAEKLGAPGKDRVVGQLKDLKDMAQIDDDTYTLLKQIVIDGHDGAHPYLPSLDEQRAQLLLELMKDVLYQLFVRKAKLEKAMLLRRTAIDQGVASSE